MIDRTAPWKPWQFNLLVGFLVLAYIAVAVFVVFEVPAILLREWLPDDGSPESDADETRGLLALAAQVVLLALGGVVAAAGVGLSVARHRHALLDARREQNKVDMEQERMNDDRLRELRSRFVSAVTFLSGPEPIQRQAGLYALAALADDWATFGRRDEVQVCIDVLAAYLRAPLPLGIDRTPPDEVAVRQAAFAILSDKLSNPDVSASWGHYRIDLSEATVDYRATLRSPRIGDGGLLVLHGAAVRAGGSLSINDAAVSHSGRLLIGSASVTGPGLLTLPRLLVEEDGTVSISYISLSDSDARLLVEDASVISGGTLSLTGVQVRSGAAVTVGGATVGDGAQLKVIRPVVLGGGVFDIPSFGIEGTGRLHASNSVDSDVDIYVNAEAVEPGKMLTLGRRDRRPTDGTRQG